MIVKIEVVVPLNDGKNACYRNLESPFIHSQEKMHKTVHTFCQRRATYVFVVLLFGWSDMAPPCTVIDLASCNVQPLKEVDQLVAVLIHTCKRELSPAHLVCPRRHNA
jgi:hypothetical protein